MATQSNIIAALSVSYDTMHNCDYQSHHIVIKSGDKAAWNKMIAIDKAEKGCLKMACMAALRDGTDIAWGNTFVTIVWAK